MQTISRRYSTARNDIQDGDVLLWRHPRALTSLEISVSTRSVYSHASLAAWWGTALMNLETREWFGGRAVLLSHLVRANPGRIDVYQPHVTAQQRRATVCEMRQITGTPYGWSTIGKHLLLSLPIIRLFQPTPDNDTANGHLLVCSSAIAQAYRLAKVDLVPNLSDWATTPGDLGRSSVLEYQFTLGA